ncbi:MAG TPA: HD-GYP domain-containing protein [Solirubrobacterales bacterium]
MADKPAIETRSIRAVIALELVALAGAIALAVWANRDSDWYLPLFVVLLISSVVGDLTALDAPTRSGKISSSFLAIIVATVLLGPTPAAVIGVVTILVGWTRFRYARSGLLINLVAYAWFPLLSGVAFNAVLRATGTTHTDGLFYVLVFAMFAVALLINYSITNAHIAYVEEGSSFLTRVARTLLPVLPSELIAGLTAVGLTYVYLRAGLSTVVILAITLLVLQYLIGALLISQQRADELELRAKQLAGFQVALLGALLRTLDLRDRMTARHSAAVARYSREIAAAAGFPESEQELVHTAGLLHDIGKFVLPDRILKGDVELTEEDWEEIKKHPYEGARIVSQIDGYQPVGELVLAHHERMDGLGYPRGLQGENIPALARIISVADTYDVLTARDSYREPVSSFEALTELRRVAGTQLDGRFVEILNDVLSDKGFSYRHGEDADFEAELALDKRIHDYVTASSASGLQLSP